MTVKIPIIDMDPLTQVGEVVDRVDVLCEIVDDSDPSFPRVRILEDAAGKLTGDEIVVFVANITS